MNRLTLGSVKSMIARVLAKCDADAIDYINRAQQRLLYPMKSVGTYGRYRICINEACVTMPREIETVEALAICNSPGTVRGEWFEFLGAGPGILKEDTDIGDQIVDRGEAPAFDDVRGDDKKIAVYTDQPEAAGATINIQYYDANGQWVRTSYNGSWIDGENIVLEKGVYNLTSVEVAPLGLIRVIKPVTNGVIRLYEYDTDAGTYKPLAYYQPGETIPVYRRYMLPNIQNRGTTGSSASCDTTAVHLVGKLRHIPVVADNDFLLISHSDAIRLMCQAIKKEEDNLLDEAVGYEAQAFKLLDHQLQHYKGDGEIQPIAMLGNDITGPGVVNLV